MDPYTHHHLRVPGNVQLNTAAATHQFTHNRNLHQINPMTAFNNCAKNQKKQSTTAAVALNQLPSMNASHSNGQPAPPLMNGHYNSSPNGSSTWFHFNSRQPQPPSHHANRDPTMRPATENGNPSFNPNPFALHSHYDPSGFMSAASFGHQPAKSSSTSYLSSMAAADAFMNQMKKADSNFRHNTSPYGKGINMSEMANTCNNSSNLTTAAAAAASSFFTPHHATANGWPPPHHQQNFPNNGVMQHESMNRTCNSSGGNTACMNGVKKSQQANHAHHHPQPHHPQQQYKSVAPTPFSNMSLNSNNSYLNFPATGNCSTSAGQPNHHQHSFGNGPSSLGAAKFAADHYASFAFAAAAMNSEYAFQQQQQKNHHHHPQQYMPGMNNFATNSQPDYNGSNAFDSSSLQPNHHHHAHQNGLINYCSTSLFPMAESNFHKSHNPFMEEYSSHLSSAPTVSTPSTAAPAKKSRKKMTKAQQAAAAAAAAAQASAEATATGYDYGMHAACNGSNSTSCALNGNSNVSRCSSVASVHQMPQGDSYSYSYSPAAHSAHSPYQQRSSTSNSSHSSGGGVSCAISQQQQQAEYVNYGTPNSAPATVFPSMGGTSQTPTPTPGYPTPPSSVGHGSSSRCNSNEELSPFSNNSMSSNISQPYNRSDYKSSSSSSSSSQISPKQLDSNGSGSISENPFNSSCMVVSGKASAPSQQHKSLHNSTSQQQLYPVNNLYKSQQQQYPYGNHISGNSCSSDGYYGENGGPASHHSQEPPLLSSTVNSNYDYNGYQDSQENQFSQTGGELSTCSQAAGAHTATMMATAHTSNGSEVSSKSDFHTASPDLTSHSNFDLSFDSVIQPINVADLPATNHVDQNATAGTTANPGDIAIDGLSGDKPVPFPSIEDLNFISPPSEPSEKHDDYSSLDSSIGPQQQPQATQMGHCNDFESSHEDGTTSMMVDSGSIECHGNIQSIIDSLPKPEPLGNKGPETNELLSDCANADNCLSDLAPLMNDNSKIALMESTFKSGNTDLPPIDQTAPFDDKQLNKVIFGDGDELKLNSGIASFSKHDEENQFKDVDDFLKTNFKENAEEVFVQQVEETKTGPLDQPITTLNNSFKPVSIEIPPVDHKVNSTPEKPVANRSISSKPSKSIQKKSSQKKNSPSLLPKSDSQKVTKKRKSTDISVNIPNKKCKGNLAEKTKESNKPDGLLLKVTEKRPPAKTKRTSVKKSKEQESSTQTPSSAIIKPELVVMSQLNKLPAPAKESVKTIMDKFLTIKPKIEEVKKPVEILTVESETKENVINNSNTTSGETRSTLVQNKKNEKIQLKLNPSSSSLKKTESKAKQPEAKPCSKSPKPVATKKTPVINSKSCLKSIVTSNSNTLLPPASLMNASCMGSKSNFPIPSTTSGGTLSNVAPTLIVNHQNPPVNSYQVSPVTNAVLISIHPANANPIPSLTAPSTFITLTTQSVTSATTNTTTTTASQNTSSRRRSQDKKVATIREGLMRTGDFVVAEEESHLELPVIWRIEGKSLLQRFEHSEQNGVTVYINTSSVSFSLLKSGF